ncbi:MAG: hypothetical protein NT062_36350 [Proteobacteria bacterium]|nr:hypothetical protein [Pseudomonadota bacterium]
MNSKVIDPGLLLMGSQSREARLKTLRSVMGQDASPDRHAKLVKFFCDTEVRITVDKVESLRKKSGKLRHLNEALDVMTEAGAGDHAPAAVKKVRALVDAIENPPPPELYEGRDHITIEEQDVLLLQVAAARVGTSALEDLVFAAFWSFRSSRRQGSVWLAFQRSNRIHHLGKSDWIGLSLSVPTQTADSIQRSFEVHDLEVEREMGRALHLDLHPFARMSDDDLEILVPAGLAGDARRKRKVDRGDTSPIARGYYLKLDPTSLFP